MVYNFGVQPVSWYGSIASNAQDREQGMESGMFTKMCFKIIATNETCSTVAGQDADTAMYCTLHTVDPEGLAVEEPVAPF